MKALCISACLSYRHVLLPSAVHRGGLPQSLRLLLNSFDAFESQRLPVASHLLPDRALPHVHIDVPGVREAASAASNVEELPWKAARPVRLTRLMSSVLTRGSKGAP